MSPQNKQTKDDLNRARNDMAKMKEALTDVYEGYSVAVDDPNYGDLLEEAGNNYDIACQRVKDIKEQIIDQQ